MDVLSFAAGVAGVALAYFCYLATTKGLPAAWAWVKAKWTAGKTELATLASDLDSAHARIDALESGLKAVVTEIGGLKAAVAPAISVAAPIVAAQAAAAEPAAAPAA